MSRYLHGHRSSLKRAGLVRRIDAEELFRSRRYAGAAYLAGYKVECDLKVALMEVAGVEHLRDLEVWLQTTCGLDPDKVLHNVEVLSEHHPGVRRMLQRPEDTLNRAIIRARNDCNRWQASQRYNPRDLDQESARRMLDAVDVYSSFIQNSH